MGEKRKNHLFHFYWLSRVWFCIIRILHAWIRAYGKPSLKACFSFLTSCTWCSLQPSSAFLSSLLILFIFGRTGSSLYAWDFSSCGAQAPHCSGFLCCRAQALGSQASVVVVHGLSCPEACGIFPDQGLNSCPLHGRWILNHWTTREVSLFWSYPVLLWPFLICP